MATTGEGRDQREFWLNQLERYRATMRKVRMAMQDTLTPEEFDDLLIACEAGDRWSANQLRVALGKPPILEEA